MWEVSKTVLHQSCDLEEQERLLNCYLQKKKRVRSLRVKLVQIFAVLRLDLQKGQPSDAGAAVCSSTARVTAAAENLSSVRQSPLVHRFPHRNRS